MNCTICSRYLAFINNLDRPQCAGCRPNREKCSYLFDKCSGINHDIKCNESTPFCYECDQFPCKEIKRMDKRYKSGYNMSVIENLEFIEQNGVGKFAETQQEKYQCSKCDGLISIHNRKCFRCDKITKLVDKLD